jgi:hypothetical protein
LVFYHQQVAEQLVLRSGELIGIRVEQGRYGGRKQRVQFLLNGQRIARPRQAL